ncbi:MAG: serine/threonine-protein kinase [Steroidobacteraceae bacterium]
MSLRLLVVADRPEYRLLARKHIEIEWPDAAIHEHRLGEDEPLDSKFTAAGFDAAIIVDAPPPVAGAAPAETTPAGSLAAELAARAEFAPLIMLLLHDTPAVRPADTPRIRRLYGRKIDREGLIGAVTSASRERRKALNARRAQPDFEQIHKFGAMMIRGHRCIRQVGSGGMCKIYLAESERAATLVVLKVFSQVPDVSERIVGFDRFLQEYEIVAGLNHPNIVRIYDLGIADDHAYIAMEHFPAGDLRQRMKAPVPPETALSYLKQIASALDAIHAVGVLHRDLKPANVMLRADGTLCLIDFGLAKANELDAELTGTREIFGTPYYMSPEQGHAELIDARSDLYSLGVVYYEMLIGRKPYTGASAMEVIYKHKRAELPAIDPKYSSHEPILKRLLAKSPQDRFQSAREVLKAADELKIPA